MPELEQLRIEEVQKKDILLWSQLWKDIQQDSHNQFIRKIDEAYFAQKYLDRVEQKGYAIYSSDNALVGFFGVRSEIINTMKCAAFVDFIIVPEHKMKGYLGKTVELLKESILKDKEAFIFYPIHRQAMIAWKFILSPQIVEALNRWAILLQNHDCEDRNNGIAKSLHIELIPLRESELNQFFNDDFLRWRFMEQLEKHHHYKIIADGILLGTISLKEISWNEKSGVELGMIKVSDLSVLQVQSILNEVITFAKKCYSFFIFKTSADSVYDEFFKEWDRSIKVCEKQYKFMLLNTSKQHEQIQEITLGEVLDVPRDDEIIKQLYRS